MKNFETCYLCASTKTPALYSKLGAYELLQCQVCNIIQTTPFGDKTLELYQDPAYYTEHGGSGFNIDGFVKNGLKDGLAHYYDRHRFQPFLKAVKKRYGGQGIKYLDIGCSAGLMLAIAREYGWEAIGVEASSAAAAAGERKLGLKIRTQDMQYLEIKPKSYQAISLFHVLEHLTDPRQTLQKIHSMLDDDGILAIEVPNVQSWPAQLRKKDWHGYVIPYHLWHFSPATLRRLLEQAGFSCLFMSTPYVPCSTAHIINIHVSASKVVKKMQAAAPHASAPQGPSKFKEWLEPAVRWFYWPSDRLMGLCRRGVALYALAEKSR